MKRIFRNKYVTLLIIIIIIIGVVFAFVHANKTSTTIVENVTHIVVSPVQKIFTGIGSSVGDFFGYFSDVNAIKEENKKLKIANSKLNQQIQKLKGNESENENLRKMLDLKQRNPKLELVGAEIIARDATNWYGTITIDKGLINGLALNQPIVSESNALIGRISEIGSTWAKVVTLTDSSHSVGCDITRSKDLGILDGDSKLSKSGYCKMSYISKNTDIIIGDYIETSGLGGIYPKGIQVGKVLEIKSDIQGISQYAVIAPLADLNAIKKVFVVKNEIEQISE